MAGESNRAMRPFWMHQFVEYIIGASFVSTAIASSTPAVPVVLGGLILVNAAVAVGPAGAFRLVHRQVHRILDLVILVLIVVASVQPVIEVQNGTRLLMLSLALVMAFVWWNSDFATRDGRKERRGSSPARAAGRAAAARPDSAELGKAAGRSAAGTYLAAKRLKKAMVDDRKGDAAGSARPAPEPDRDRSTDS